MRVITGTARGRKLETPEGLGTRPTSEKVKEAVFSSIQFEVEGANVLDLFAGSGQMGIEALSRGARFCVFVDHARESHGVLRRNLSGTGLGDKARLMMNDAFAFLGTASGPFDIAFLDPPYQAGMLARLLPAVAEKMSASGVILCESSRDEAPPQRAGAFGIHRQRRYGKTVITTYRIPQEDAE